MTPAFTISSLNFAMAESRDIFQSCRGLHELSQPHLVSGRVAPQMRGECRSLRHQIGPPMLSSKLVKDTILKVFLAYAT